jgi:uncharacterized OB-fold protein/acyl dehydratase
VTLPAERKRELEEKLRAFVGVEAGHSLSPDPVNEAMIRHWCEVVGDRNPVYRDPDAAKSSVHGGLVAPPPMLNAWTMPAFIPPWVDESGPPPNREVELHRLLTSYGYTGVVATNHDQEYRRYLRPGDRIHAVLTIESISEEKSTPLGVGYFIDVLWEFRDQNDQEVGRLRFRTLKYRPAQPTQAVEEGAAAPARPRRLAPPLGHDNAWWWEGIERGELLIQKCSECGALRHPPRPMCGQCQSLVWEGQVASGRGRVHSYTVLHHPKVPGYEYPLVVALVDLEEGTRLVANVAGCEPAAVAIGMSVQASIEAVDDQLRLPVFRPAGASGKDR